ncbi:MAG: rhodanese-like domain-containing protein [Alphaproteobacteria bacterium]|nr:rhodanese-like domain-containing protein [Alphaproteobacteria bacterium]
MSGQDETAQTVHDALQRGAITLIDVREPAEFGAERIHGALLFPMSTFDPTMLPQDAKKPIVFHCGSGKRSARALARCAEAGVAARGHMEGGLGAWKAAGLATVTIDPATGAVRDGA